MAASPTGNVLSGSTDGLPIVVAATGTPGTLIHTATASAGFDSVYLWASNVTGSAATLTIEWGSVSDPGGHMVKAYSIAANSPPIPIATGQRIANSKVIRAFSGTGSAINITGYYNRIFL
jgi:hypothetical protein